jgi:hypothetical protein
MTEIGQIGQGEENIFKKIIGAAGKRIVTLAIDSRLKYLQSDIAGKKAKNNHRSYNGESC